MVSWTVMAVITESGWQPMLARVRMSAGMPELELPGLRGAQGGFRDGGAMRVLHTMLRVGDLQRSIDFYTDVLGMRLLRKTDRPEQRYTLAFVGYGDEAEHAVLELTYNYGVERYDLGSGYGHIAIEVSDARATCEAVRAQGGKVTRDAGPVKGGTTVIAVVEDPDGYKVEFI